MQNEAKLSRRSLLGASTLGASTFTLVRPQLVRGAGKAKLKAGIVGCGGRGTQAVIDMLTGNDNVELVAMADIFEDHLEKSLGRLRDPKFQARHAGIAVERSGVVSEQNAQALAASIAPRIAVKPDMHFTGFDAFQKLINSDVDIVMLTTPPGYRPQHFEAAIKAGKHVFTEKPIATDPVGVRRFLAAAQVAREKKLTVVSGSQRHAEKSRVETVQKIHNGELGEIVALYSRYLQRPVFHADARDPKWGDMEWEHRNWYSFVWICGDQIVEQHYHNIDFMNWVMQGHPVSVVASGGRAWRTKDELYGNIYDHMASDFVYANGVRLSSHCRQYPGEVYRLTEDLVVCTKGKSNGTDRGGAGINPYVQEHINLVNSILGLAPYRNEAVPVAEATMTAIMARESAYSGQEVTWDMIMKSKLDLQPKAFDYKLQMNPPEIPVPGKYKFV